MFLFLFLFSLSHFSIFFNVKDGRTPLYVAAANEHEQIVQILLKKGNLNVDLATNVLLLIVSFSFFFFFSLFHFFLFFNVKDGRTPLYIAAANGHEQIVEILLEKGEPNVDLPNQVLLLFILNLFLFLFLFHFLTFLF